MYPPSTNPASLLPDIFPALPGPSGPIPLKECVEKWTGVYVFLGYCVLFVLALFATLMIYPIIIALIGALVTWIYRKRILAQIRGTYIQVNDSQFPEIHRCVQEVSQALGMAEAPDVYIMEGNQLNAFAMKVVGKKMVFLLDDVVDACLRSGNPGTLTFIIAHELAHQALGHTWGPRPYIRQMVKALSRKDEFSCDAVAGRVVNNPDTCILALTILMSGPQLLKYVNMPAMVERARLVSKDKHAIKSERQLTHPLTYRRIGRFC